MKSMKKLNLILVISIILVVISIISIPLKLVYAASPDNNSPLNHYGQNGYIITLNNKTKEFLSIYVNSGIMNEIAFNKNGKVVLRHNDINYLIKRYGVSASFINKLKLSVNNLNNRHPGKYNLGNVNAEVHQPINPDIFVSNGKIYFTSNDVTEFLLAAATEGPAALYVELEAISTMIAGLPGATIMEIILGAIDIPSLAGLCYTIIQAASLHEGIYIGLRWNHHIFPIIYSGTWYGGY